MTRPNSTTDEAFLTRVQLPAAEVGVARFLSGDCALVVQDTRSTIIVDVPREQAVRLAHALLGAQ